MNLDDLRSFAGPAQQKLLSEIDALPGTLLDGFAAGTRFDPGPAGEIRNVVLAGSGDSIIGADLLAAYVAPTCPAPVIVHRDYGLPGFAGPGTLFVALSHSGETQETLSALEAAAESKCRVLAMCGGGSLAELAAKAGAPVWNPDGVPSARAGLGFSFGLLLAVFERLGLVPEQGELLRGAVGALETERDGLRPASPVSRNLAKRMAGQLMGRLVTVFAAGQIVPVARRWKAQINEVAKSIAHFEPLPEADYGTLQGAAMPEAILLHSMALFLRAPSDQRQNRLRSNLTRRALMLEGVNTDFVDARGETPLAHLWTLTQLGDYIAFYLSAAYGIDPTPTPAPENPTSLK